MNWLKISSFIFCGSLVASCADDGDDISNGQSRDMAELSLPHNGSTALNANDVKSYEDLQLYLNQKYGGIEELPFAALFTAGRDNRVALDYRLPDGRVISVSIIFTQSGSRILDPEFDLESLPD